MSEKNEFNDLLSMAQPWFSRLNLPIAIIDFKTLNIIYLNSQLEDLIGTSAKKIVGGDLYSVFDSRASDTLKSVVDLYKQNFNAFVPTERDLKIIRRSGRPVPVTCSFSGLHIENREVIVISFMDQSNDIEDRNRFAEDLKAVYHMSKLADLGKVAASVAHEINNPLMVIQGQAELLELKSAKSILTPEEVTRLLGPIYRAVERMSQIVSQMKTVSRSPKQQFEKIDLSLVLEDSGQMLSQRGRFLGVNFSVFSPPNIWIEGNRTQIEQVVLNILGNAFDALEESESIDSGEKVASIDVKQDQGYAVIEIWNNGPPIPDTIQNQIMSPFFTTKTVGKGTGLGLSVCAGIIKSHNGSLKLKYSDNVRGTCFEIKIPCLNDSTKSNRKKVLVVDDEQLVRNVMKDRLQAMDYEVYLAKNGKEALEVLISIPDIKIVFTDLRMPVMDGSELILQLRKAFEQIRIVILSGYLETFKPPLGVPLKVDAMLEKPFKQSQLNELLSKFENEENSVENTNNKIFAA